MQNLQSLWRDHESSAASHQRFIPVCQIRARADEMKAIQPKAIMLRIAADYEELAKWAEENKLSTLVGQETECELEPRRPLR